MKKLKPTKTRAIRLKPPVTPRIDPEKVGKGLGAKPQFKTRWTERPLLPPRLRDWKEGTPQVGVFLRAKDGSTVQCVRELATENDVTLVLSVVYGAEKMPELLSQALRSWLDTLKKQA